MLVSEDTGRGIGSESSRIRSLDEQEMAWVVVCDVGGQCYTPHEIDAITYDNSMPRRYFNSVDTNCDTVEQSMTSRILGKSVLFLFCFNSCIYKLGKSVEQHQCV